jgi:hypothetical protein
MELSEELPVLLTTKVAATRLPGITRISAVSTVTAGAFLICVAPTRPQS